MISRLHVEATSYTHDYISAIEQALVAWLRRGSRCSGYSPIRLEAQNIKFITSIAPRLWKLQNAGIVHFLQNNLHEIIWYYKITAYTEELPTIFYSNLLQTFIMVSTEQCIYAKRLWWASLSGYKLMQQINLTQLLPNWLKLIVGWQNQRLIFRKWIWIGFLFHLRRH